MTRILQFQEYLLQRIVALDLLHGAGADQLAALDDGNLVAELFGHLQHVGGEEDGAALRRRSPASCP